MCSFGCCDNRKHNRKILLHFAEIFARAGAQLSKLRACTLEGTSRELQGFFRLPAMHSEADPTPACTNDPLVGLTVGDLFTIESLIGAGATSRVYRASHLGLRRFVAIKVLNYESLQAPAARGRFHREARVAARITHPAVVPVLMTGQFPMDNVTGGEAFIVYEYVDGLTLRQVLDTTGPLSIATILGILVAASEAVGAAHVVGIVHRDFEAREPDDSSTERE